LGADVGEVEGGGEGFSNGHGNHLPIVKEESIKLWSRSLHRGIFGFARCLRLPFHLAVKSVSVQLKSTATHCAPKVVTQGVPWERILQ
jgi:hypothetical protein